MVEDMNEIDALLRRRDVPDTPRDLSLRIIEAARKAPQYAHAAPPPKTRGGLRAWFDTLFESLLMPKPAFAMALFLFVGVALGIYAAEPAPEVRNQQSSFIYVEDDFNTGDWL